MRKRLLICLVIILSACKTEQEKAQEYYQSGADYLAAKEYTSAELEFKNAIKLDRYNMNAQFGMATIYEAKKRWVELEKTLKQILDFDPSHTQARIKLANLYLGQNQIDKAMAQTEQLMAEASTNPVVKTLRAAVLYKIDDKIDARRLVSEVLADSPEHIDAVVLRAHDLLSEDKAADAVALLEKALTTEPQSVVLNIVMLQALGKTGDTARIKKVYRTLMDVYPGNSNIPLSYARFLARNGDHAQAVAFLQEKAAQAEEPEYLFKAIELINDQQGIDAAEEQTKAYLQQYPQMKRLVFALVDIYVKTGKLTEALAQLNTVWSAQADSQLALEAGLRKGRLELLSGDLDAATATIDRLQELDSGSAKVAVLKGDLLLARGDPAAAIRLLRTALRQVSEDADLFATLAKAHRVQNENELANEYYGKAVRAQDGVKYAQEYGEFLLQQNALEQADQLLSELIARKLGSQKTRVLLAQVKLAKGDWQAAEQLADQIEQQVGEEPGTAYIRGMAASAKDDPLAAVAAMEDLQRLMPDSMRSMVLLVDAYIRAGKRADAEAFLNRVIATDDRSYAGYYLRGNLYAHYQEWAAAEADYRSAIRHQSDSEQAYNTLARLQLQRGAREAAAETLDQGMAAIPASDALPALRAELYRQAGELNRAIALYRQLLQRNESLDVVANNLASTLIAQGGDANVRQALSIASRFRASNVPQFMDTLGWAYVLNNQYDDGLSLLRRAADALPNVAEITYHLAEGYFRKGDSTQALALVNNALSKAGAADAWVEDANRLKTRIQSQN